MTRRTDYSWIETTDEPRYCMADVLIRWWHLARIHFLRSDVKRLAGMLDIDKSDSLRDELKRKLWRLSELEALV